MLYSNHNTGLNNHPGRGQQREIGQQVAVYQDQIGLFTLRNRADPVVQPQQFGRSAGGRVNGLPGW